MNDENRKLQHTMLSFALWGGMLVNNRGARPDGERVFSCPSNFVPFKIDRAGR